MWPKLGRLRECLPLYSVSLYGGCLVKSPIHWNKMASNLRCLTMCCVNHPKSQWFKQLIMPKMDNLTVLLQLVEARLLIPQRFASFVHVYYKISIQKSSGCRSLLQQSGSRFSRLCATAIRSRNFTCTSDETIDCCPHNLWNWKWNNRQVTIINAFW